MRIPILGADAGMHHECPETWYREDLLFEKALAACHDDEIFLTAKAVGTEVERMMALGAAGVLIKPFDPRTLSGDVRALIKQPLDVARDRPLDS